MARVRARSQQTGEPDVCSGNDDRRGCGAQPSDEPGGEAGHPRLVARYRVRVVRLLPLRLARRHHRRAVLQPVSGSDAQRVRAARLRRRLPGAAVRRAGVRPARRSGRPQIHLPHHHPDHGRVDLPGRLPAELRHDRLRRTGRADRAAHGAGPRARRRIRRRGDLRRGACASRQARLLHQLDPDHRDARPAALAHHHHVHADLRERQLSPRSRPPPAPSSRRSRPGAGAFRSWSRSCCSASRCGSACRCRRARPSRR